MQLPLTLVDLSLYWGPARWASLDAQDLIPSKMRDIVNYYMRTQFIEDNDEMQYPIELNIIIQRFVGNILLIFDTIKEEYRNYIQNDGLLLKIEGFKLRDAFIPVCSSYKFDSGVHKIRIKVIQGGNDAFGIISNTTIINSTKYHGYAQANMYYYFGGGRLCIGYNNKEYGNDQDRFLVSDQARVNVNDIITIKLDCSVVDAWNVSFYLNDTQVWKDIDIVSKDAYHLFISTKGPKIEYEIVDYIME